VQGRSDDQRELLDAESVAGHLLKSDSVFAFLAAHRQELFPEAMFANLFPSRRGRPSVPAEVMASVITLQALHGLSDNETVEAVTFDLRRKAACGVRGPPPSEKSGGWGSSGVVVIGGCLRQGQGITRWPRSGAWVVVAWCPVSAGRSWSLVPSPRCSLQVAWRSRSALSPPMARVMVWSAARDRLSSCGRGL
jgi:hypothetical protein